MQEITSHADIQANHGSMELALCQGHCHAVTGLGFLVPVKGNLNGTT